MVEPEKPFACTIPDCGMTFTNEDHLHVHTKKHDMVLQLGSEQKAAFVADQTPTPTRFIRNCEEVGLFQDLQNVNPFDEGFKRAMETKQGVLSLENAIAASVSEDLHTPQMIFPLIDGTDSTLYASNNQRNITISRSSSDESGAIKEFETTTISKLTNEVTTISRIVEKHDDGPKNDDPARSKEGIRKDSVSYTNNVIKIHSEIRKDNVEMKIPGPIIYEDTVIKDGVVTKDVLFSDTLQVPDIPPIMSQKSIDNVVDSLTSDLCNAKEREEKINIKREEDNYEVIIKLPNGKQVRMKAVEELNEKSQGNTKERLKKALAEKAEAKSPILQRVHSVPTQIVSNILPITTGTLIPVTIVGPNVVRKVPIPLNPVNPKTKAPLKRNCFGDRKSVSKEINKYNSGEDDNCVIVDTSNSCSEKRGLEKECLDSRSAASRRYRAKLKKAWDLQAQENCRLKEINQKLVAEQAMLKLLITEHMKNCPNADDLRQTQEKLKECSNI